MRVAFLLADPNDLHIVRAAREADITVPLLLVPSGVSAALSAEDRIVACDSEIAASTALLAHRVDVLVSLTVPPAPASPLFNARWTVLCRHRSLLPRHRGLDPVWHAIAQGDSVAGVSIHLADRVRTYDGPLLVQRPVPIDPFDTLASLQRKLADCEGDLVVNALRRFAGGSTFIDQDEREASMHETPVDDADRRLDPDRPLVDLVDPIRACDPRIGPAWFELEGQPIGVRLWRLDRPEGTDPDSM